MRPSRPPEDSTSLRFITSAMAIVGILAACHLAETPAPLALFGIFGTAIGSIISYWRRQSNNFWVKWAIAAGVIVVLGVFIESIAYRIQASIADAREPLTNMLIALQALHSFDLPKRRDLNVSALVGLTLMASAATLSRDITFGVYLAAFFSFGSYMLYLDCTSRTLEGAANTSADSTGTRGATGQRRSPSVLLVTLIPLLSLGFFLVMPKLNLELLRNVRVSIKVNIPMLPTTRVSNPMLSHAKQGDGSLAVNPLAYFGFDEDLDLNYRGELSDQVVMTVSCPHGQLWRCMAFDTYDGHHWSMSKPKVTFDRLTSYGSLISLAPIPSLTIPRSVPVFELVQTFTMEVDQPNLVPAAMAPEIIYFPASKIQVDSYGSLRSPMLMEKDMVYTVFSHVPIYSLKTLSHAPPMTPETSARMQSAMANYLQIPDELPDSVRQLATREGGQGRNAFVRAQNIQNFLRDNYTYDLSVPATPDRVDVVADFLLKRKRGYCEHFATSFVILCRAAGIPARLVTGFHPGEYNPFTGLWEVRMRDAHAWAEIFIPRWGWIPFDPVPDGVPPGYQGLSKKGGAEYILEWLSKVFAALYRLPAMQALAQQISALAAPVASAFTWTFYLVFEIWKPLAATMIALGVAAFALSLAHRAGKIAPKSRMLAPPGGTVAPSTAEFLKVCRDLESLEVNRLPQDTASDLSARIQAKAASGSLTDNDLPVLVQDFLEQYSQERFGSGEPEWDLVSLSGKIHDRIRAHPHDKQV